MSIQFTAECERWGLFELSVDGRSGGNPFADYTITAVFTHKKETRTIRGFYDGEGIYRVRFMPSYEGVYHFRAEGNFSDQVYEGSFKAAPAAGINHGPVRVSGRYHFSYADGTPHFNVGTTCYAFALQKKELVEETFRELRKQDFNKMRFCFFPKHYDFCLRDPDEFPYAGTPMDASVLTRENFMTYNGNPEGNSWNFRQFNPAYFRVFDEVVLRLMEMGIEADMILFHAYDRWGFSVMQKEDMKFFLEYIIARYGAYRNIWWSLANEYELMKTMSCEDWDEMGTFLHDSDPYHHLLSIHNCETFYDYGKSWITHCSCQRCDHHKTTEDTDLLRKQYGKPVVWDEVGYEGDFPHCWGNFTPEELTRRAWEAVIRGGYCGHSETFLSPDEIIWWSHGGTIKGESARRFRFLKQVMEDAPACGLKLGRLRDDIHFQWDDYAAIPEDDERFGEYFFFYFSIWRPSFRDFWIDDETEYDVDIIDTWDMTVIPAGRHKGKFQVELPRKQYIGVRLRRRKNGKNKRRDQ